MARETWRRFVGKARNHYFKCNANLQEAVRMLMKDKGFPEDIVGHFECCFTSGVETVITFDRDGEFADLDLDTASDMTREEIISCMGRFMGPESLAKMKGTPQGSVEEILNEKS